MAKWWQWVNLGVTGRLWAWIPQQAEVGQGLFIKGRNFDSFSQPKMFLINSPPKKITLWPTCCCVLLLENHFTKNMWTCSDNLNLLCRLVSENLPEKNLKWGLGLTLKEVVFHIYFISKLYNYATDNPHAPNVTHHVLLVCFYYHYYIIFPAQHCRLYRERQKAANGTQCPTQI